jgi:hypothetical protein
VRLKSADGSGDGSGRERGNTLEGLYELVESMLFEKARFEDEVRKARELIFDLVGDP